MKELIDNAILIAQNRDHLRRLASHRRQRSNSVILPSSPDPPLPTPTLRQCRHCPTSSPPTPSSFSEPSSLVAPSLPPRRPRVSIFFSDQICSPPLS
ncbi:hypothetical protein L484_014049 [Morus notabilis]|uniref:Uncharacterized protein n=1 Tax=Morus notabilis TaxID=981085 RepID=W9QN67_9ROSA|nr:hypothetical protein L484_014049 [Morus notabilis]